MPPVKRRRRARKDRRHTLTGTEGSANGRSEERARCNIVNVVTTIETNMKSSYMADVDILCFYHV